MYCYIYYVIGGFDSADGGIEGGEGVCEVFVASMPSRSTYNYAFASTPDWGEYSKRVNEKIDFSKFL